MNTNTTKQNYPTQKPIGTVKLFVYNAVKKVGFLL